MEKKYKTIGTQPMVAKDPMAVYGCSRGMTSPIFPSTREANCSTHFPGLFTEEEKKARLKESIESIRHGKGISEEEMDVFCESLV
jgi:hypothetical protein